MFTPEQFEWFAAYEKVRQSGQYNMFDRYVHIAARLSREQYFFVLGNFSALQKANTEAEEVKHILAQADD